MSISSAFCVVGVGWGDEAKGLIVDSMTRLHHSTLNVRFNGGPQAMHNVVLPNGRHHCFSQFGAGSFQPNVRTHISRFALIEPYAMLNEAEQLSKVGVPGILERLTIDPDCVIVTPWHWMANRLREKARGDNRHGSGGMGIGEARGMELRGLALRLGDLRHRPLTAAILTNIRNAAILSLPSTIPADYLPLYQEMLNEPVDRNVDFYRDWATAIRSISRPSINGPVVFEGSQGVMLDETHGTAPHNTWTNCTFENAVTLCGEWGLEPVKIGVLRTYSTRHGAGPFVAHDPAYDFPDHNKGTDSWQGEFRQGPFDMVAARYAVRVARPDCLALTHVDLVPVKGWEYCARYTIDGNPVEDVDFTDAGLLWRCRPDVRRALNTTDPVEFIEKALRVPIVYTTHGPTYQSFHPRREAVFAAGSATSEASGSASVAGAGQFRARNR